ncbi:hypothetical protein Tco_1171758 [Tanacetum coccineum]
MDVKFRTLKNRLKMKLFGLATKKLNEANTIVEDGEQEMNFTDEELLQALDIIETQNTLLITIIMEYLVKDSKRRVFWSLNEDILKITILTTNTPYPSRKIWRICACTHQRLQRNEAQLIPSEPEREFRSSRRHFKTLSLDELRSPDFNLFSDQEYSKEEVAETMAETMEQYMSKTRANYGSGVARPKLKTKITLN